MKITRPLAGWVAVVVIAILNSHLLRAQGTAFTYQGRLNDSGSPANGVYDFRFRLAADPLANSYVGSSYLTNGIGVMNGLFITTLDFGAGIFTGSNYWLEVDVRTNGAGSYTVLTPLQAMTPMPYAVMANSASNLLGLLPTAQLTGTILAAGLSGPYSGAVNFSNAANSFSGAFRGNGANVSNVNAATVGGLAPANFWQTGGNAGTTGVNFLGTTDNHPLELRVNGQRALRLEPDAVNGAPSVIGGAVANVVGPGSLGSAIGGGSNNTVNSSSPYSTIAGGQNNAIQGTILNSAIGGGWNNTVQPYANFSVIGGGWNNTIMTNAFNSAISGGSANTIQINSYNSFIGGGSANGIQANALFATVVGGVGNSVSSGSAAIVGGTNNTIQVNAIGSFIGGGNANQVYLGPFGGADANYSTIGGGHLHTISTHEATIAGGVQNTAGGAQSVVAGGYNNVAFDVGAAVGGGWGNYADAYAVVAGGNGNAAQGDQSAILGGQQNKVSFGATYSTIAGGLKNTNNGQFTFIGGGVSNSASSASAVVVGGTSNAIQANATGSFIGGGNANVINNSFDLAGNGNYATIGGGSFNTVGVHDATIGGGLQNRAGGAQSTVAGGYNNLANGIGAAVGGGWGSQAGTYAAVAGGIGNVASGTFSAIPGGTNNLASGDYSFAAGRRAKATHTGSFVWADSTDADLATTASNQYLIRATGGVGIGTNNSAGAALNVNGKVTATTFSGDGAGLTSVNAGQLSGIVPSAQLSGTYSGAVTFSSTANSFTGNGTGLTNVNAAALGGLTSSSFWQLGGNNVSGGQFLGSTNNQPVTIQVNGIQALQISPTTNNVSYSNIVNIVGGSPVNFIAPGVYGAVIAGGGAQMLAGTAFTNSISSDLGVVGGGGGNTIQSNTFASTIGGGHGNTIEAACFRSTIAGGGQNTIQFDADESTIGGGIQNTIQPSAQGSTIAGGFHNAIQTNAPSSTIGGGIQNIIQPLAVSSTIGGGLYNSIQTNAGSSTISGGRSNSVLPYASYSTIGGGLYNTNSGSYATVPGGDQNAAGTNSFAAGHRAKATHTGSFVWADSTDADLGTTTANQFLIRATGGVGIGTNNPQSALHVVGTVTATAFNPPSDRNVKENFAPVSPREVLNKVAALPISRWNFKGDAATSHMGPMAQDFYAAFGVGTDDRHIATVDADGVALAAIQGLNQKLEQQRAENAELKGELAQLKELVQLLNGKLNGEKK